MEQTTTEGLETITVRQYIDGAAKGRRVFTKNAFGVEEVTGINWPETDPWIVCGKANAGFGISYCVHYGTTLYVQPK